MLLNGVISVATCNATLTSPLLATQVIEYLLHIATYLVWGAGWISLVVGYQKVTSYVFEPIQKGRITVSIMLLNYSNLRTFATCETRLYWEKCVWLEWYPSFCSTPFYALDHLFTFLRFSVSFVCSLCKSKVKIKEFARSWLFQVSPNFYECFGLNYQQKNYSPFVLLRSTKRVLVFWVVIFGIKHDKKAMLIPRQGK